MPAKNKTAVGFEIEEDHKEWLSKMADQFELGDESKALRVLLDFALRDVDEALVFAPENMRCRHCV